MALPTLAPSGPSESESGSRPQPKREHILLAVVAVVALLAGGWYFFLRSPASTPAAAPVVHKPIVHATGAAGAKAGTTAAPAAAGTSAPAGDAALTAYVAKANAICAKTDTRFAALDQSDTSTTGEIALLDQEIPLANKAVRELQALAAPAAQAAQFRALWKSDAHLFTLAHQFRGALNDGNPNTAAQIWLQLSTENKALDAKFTAAGLTACGASS